MAVALIGGLALSAIGTGFAASGASKNARAIRKEQRRVQAREDAFANEWNQNLETLVSDKRSELDNLGTIFDRMTSSGAFGNTETLRNLRQTQEDFSALAAGDFSGFESQLRSALNDQFIRSAGSPVGTYTQLGAETMLNLRLAGAQQSQSTTALLNDLSYQALGHEFGIMDQQFNTGYQIGRNRLSAINQAGAAAAQTQGVQQSAIGQGMQQFGSVLTNYGITQSQRVQNPMSTNVTGYRTATDRAINTAAALAPVASAVVSNPRPVQTPYDVAPSLPSYTPPSFDTGMLPASGNFNAYNSLLDTAYSARTIQNLPFVGGYFGQISQVGSQIAGGMSF